MTHSILIDADRVIHAETEQSPLPAEFTTLQSQVSGSTVVTVNTLPAHFRRWRVLSDDNLTCTDPDSAHSSRVLGTRRQQVIDWAVRNTTGKAMLYGARNPDRFALWINVNRAVLAACYHDSIISVANVGLWSLINDATDVDTKEFIDEAVGWTSTHINNAAALTHLYLPIRGIVGGPPNPRAVTSVTAEQLASGKAWADLILFENAEEA